jgi:hypothetical protein
MYVLTLPIAGERPDGVEGPYLKDRVVGIAFGGASSHLLVRDDARTVATRAVVGVHSDGAREFQLGAPRVPRETAVRLRAMLSVRQHPTQ